MIIELQYFFYYVPHATPATGVSRNISSNMLDLRHRISRCTPQSHLLHHRIIRNIISHIQDLIFQQSVLSDILQQFFLFIFDFKEYIRNTQLFQPQPHSLRSATGDYCHPVSFFYSQLKGISILDVHCPYLLAGVKDLYGAVCQHSVYVKDKSPDQFELFQHAHDELFLIITPLTGGPKHNMKIRNFEKDIYSPRSSKGAKLPVIPISAGLILKYFVLCMESS